MKCKDCPYYWRAEGERFAQCHYGYDDGCAPCEIEDDYEPEDYREEC